MDFKIGAKLKALRNNKKMSIAKLSEISEVSTGLISQIERDLVVPSVISLWRLANALDTNINYFFETKEDDDNVIIRHGEHKVIITQKSNSYYKLLSTNKKGHILDMTEIRLKSGCVYEQEALCHEGEECGYVLKGELTVFLNGKDYILNEGDSIYFSSTLPHKYINNSDEECISIWAMTPAFF